MLHKGFGVARCTVEGLSADPGFQGVISGEPICTKVQDKAASYPLYHGSREGDHGCELEAVRRADGSFDIGAIRPTAAGPEK